MNTIPTGTAFPHTTADRVSDLAHTAADKADGAIQGTKKVANEALDTLQDNVDSLRETVPGAVTRAAASVEALARKGIERARQSSATVQTKISEGGDAARTYIQDEPVKSVLIAAATGAAVAALITWLSKSRSPRV